MIIIFKKRFGYFKRLRIIKLNGQGIYHNWKWYNFILSPFSFDTNLKAPAVSVGVRIFNIHLCLGSNGVLPERQKEFDKRFHQRLVEVYGTGNVIAKKHEKHIGRKLS